MLKKIQSLLFLLLTISLCLGLFGCASTSNQKSADDVEELSDEELADLESDDEADFDDEGDDEEDDFEDEELADLDDEDEDAEEGGEEVDEDLAEAEKELEEGEEGEEGEEDLGEELAEDETEETVEDPEEEIEAVTEVAEEDEPEVLDETPEELPTELPPQQPQFTNKVANIKYLSEESGGSIAIETTEVATYKTRVNPEQNQFIIEIENVELPRNLQRPYNMRDFDSVFGSINAYQNPGGSLARVVVQLRDATAQPQIEQRGNILILAPSTEFLAKADEAKEQEERDSLSGGSDGRFYGRKISIELKDADIRDVFNLIAEESGANVVLSDQVKGKITIKLREVPWDQALSVIMKSKKLGYVRQGNILRVAPIIDLKAEADEAKKIRESRKALEPIRVKVLPVSYSKVTDLSKQVEAFLSPKGKVVGDMRTSSIVVTDVESNIARIRKLIRSLDIPPPQVLIEGKIVEARETFTKNIGVNWGLGGATISSGSTGISPNLRIQPSLSSGAFDFNVNIGTIKELGDLDATLALSETQENVKVISSPRIVTLHNEKASINQTTEIPIISTQLDNNGNQLRSVSFKPVRLKLDVTPQITSDGGVILQVDVLREFVGANIDSGVGAVPINSRAAQTKVLVLNGQTAVIAGIYQSDATEGETGVPWLRSIPFLGALFRAKEDRKDKTELLIFLTPRVLGQTAISSFGKGEG